MQFRGRRVNQITSEFQQPKARRRCLLGGSPVALPPSTFLLVSNAHIIGKIKYLRVVIGDYEVTQKPSPLPLRKPEAFFMREFRWLRAISRCRSVASYHHAFRPF